MPGRRFFLITVDTEGDNIWSRPRTVTTRNAEYLPRFQRLCESYGYKPTYLTNWEMTQSPAFQEFARDLLARNAGEIGMHLHAWNSPPLVPLTPDDNRYCPYLIEYPEDQMREKVRVITATIEDVFGVGPTSHRSGRWSFDERYARILVDHGYVVDCSVTPYMSWKSMLGDPTRSGGTDFTNFPDRPYFLNLEDICHAGESSLLEVPVTVIPHQYSLASRAMSRSLGVTRFGKRVANRLFPARSWLYPGSHKRKKLLRILSIAANDGREHLEMALHSSELMPGGSPIFPTNESIESWYETFEELLSTARGIFEGATLTEYYVHVTQEMVADSGV